MSSDMSSIHKLVLMELMWNMLCRGMIHVFKKYSAFDYQKYCSYVFIRVVILFKIIYVCVYTIYIVYINKCMYIFYI